MKETFYVYITTKESWLNAKKDKRTDKEYFEEEGPIIHTDIWTNTHKLFESDERPDDEDIEDAEFVKICGKGERFWVKVVAKFDDIIIGTVANSLCHKRSYDHGDYISFRRLNVYDTK